jgi:tetratricopeptide (TPR) repeat protein
MTLLASSPLRMRSSRSWAALALAVPLLAGAVSLARAAESAADLSSAALAECEAGRKAQDRGERQRHFERGQALAEQAVALDDESADAHFSLFCNLGEIMRLDGESITSLFQLRRLMTELDRTLAIKPDHVDALASKGTLLIRLPRLLGGDAEKGEKMLRQVIKYDPNAVSSRLTLAKTCEARGNREEALAFATRALQIARSQGRADKVDEAQATLAELRAER